MSVFEGQSYKINVRLFFYADHFDLYFSILLFVAIGYDKGCSDFQRRFTVISALWMLLIVKSDIVFDGISEGGLI